MPHSSFKRKATEFEAGVGKCPCGQTFEYTSERDMKMKSFEYIIDYVPIFQYLFDKIEVPKKACTLSEQQLNEAERIRKVHN